MATQSGTFAWQPALSDLIIAAYGRCQIRRAALTVEHLQDAAMAANLLQMEWANEQVNLWTVELASIVLEPGQVTYPVDPTTIMIMAAYIATEDLPITADMTEPDVDHGSPTADSISTPEGNHRIITSVDRDTYASFPDKYKPGNPTVYWFNKQVGPSIALWQPPDNRARRILHFYRARHLQDAVMGGGALADVPRHFLEAYVAGLAFKLAELYAPARMDELGQRAMFTFQKAARRDIEDSPLRIVPALTTYTSAVY